MEKDQKKRNTTYTISFKSKLSYIVDKTDNKADVYVKQCKDQNLILIFVADRPSPISYHLGQLLEATQQFSHPEQQFYGSCLHSYAQHLSVLSKKDINSFLIN